jgi:hypothetical protein
MIIYLGPLMKTLIPIDATITKEEAARVGGL